MKKLICGLLLAVLLTLAVPVPALAADTTADTGPLIRDGAGLLTADEVSTLESEARSYADAYGVAIYVLTADSMNGMERRDYAESYYRDNGLGCGEARMGVLFLLSMGEREYITIDYGWAQAPQTCPFSDYAIDETEGNILPNLSDGDYYAAFERYVADYGGYLAFMAENGYAYDDPDVGDYYGNTDVPPEPGFHFSLILFLMIALGSCLVAFIVCLILKSRMKSAVAAREAGDYVLRDGVTLRVQQDHYTHSTETRVPVQQTKSGGGGGSSFNSGGFGGSSGGKF